MEVDTARRTAGRAAQTAREAADYDLDQLAQKLRRSRDELVDLETGERIDDALAKAIVEVLAGEAREAERHNSSRDPAITASVRSIKEALDAFLAARAELRKQATPWRAAERGVEARLAAVKTLPSQSRERELEAARREVEDRRMLSLKAARKEADMTARRFGEALAKVGITQPDGRPYAEAKVHEAASPDRKDRRPPTQEYVDAAIKVLAGRPAAGRAFDTLRAADRSFKELKDLGSRQPDRSPRRRHPGPRVIAAIVGIAGAIGLVLILSWPRPASRPRIAPTSSSTHSPVTPTSSSTHPPVTPTSSSPLPGCTDNLISCSNPIPVYLPHESSCEIEGAMPLRLRFRNVINGSGVAFLLLQPLDVTDFRAIRVVASSTRAFSFALEYKLAGHQEPLVSSPRMTFPQSPTATHTMTVPFVYRGTVQQVVVNFAEVGQSSDVSLTSIALVG